MMKYTVKYSTLFKKSFKKCMKRGCDSEEFKTIISILALIPQHFDLTLFISS